jgi:hypothetical protein
MKANNGVVYANIRQDVNNSGFQLAPSGDRRNMHNELSSAPTLNPRGCENRTCDRAQCLSDRMRGRLH